MNVSPRTLAFSAEPKTTTKRNIRPTASSGVAGSNQRPSSRRCIPMVYRVYSHRASTLLWAFKEPWLPSYSQGVLPRYAIGRAPAWLTDQPSPCCNPSIGGKRFPRKPNAKIPRVYTYLSPAARPRRVGGAAAPSPCVYPGCPEISRRSSVRLDTPCDGSVSPTRADRLVFPRY